MLLLNSMEGGNPIKDSKTWQEQESKFDKKLYQKFINL